MIRAELTFPHSFAPQPKQNPQQPTTYPQLDNMAAPVAIAHASTAQKSRRKAEVPTVRAADLDVESDIVTSLDQNSNFPKLVFGYKEAGQRWKTLARMPKPIFMQAGQQTYAYIPFDNSVEDCRKVNLQLRYLTLAGRSILEAEAENEFSTFYEFMEELQDDDVSLGPHFRFRTTAAVQAEYMRFPDGMKDCPIAFDIESIWTQMLGLPGKQKGGSNIYLRMPWEAAPKKVYKSVAMTLGEALKDKGIKIEKDGLASFKVTEIGGQPVLEDDEEEIPDEVLEESEPDSAPTLKRSNEVLTQVEDEDDPAFQETAPQTKGKRRRN